MSRCEPPRLIVAIGFGIVGLALTVAGALVLVWADLTATAPTWNSLVSDWKRRRQYALIGFPLIALGSAVEIVGLAIS